MALIDWQHIARCCEIEGCRNVRHTLLQLLIAVVWREARLN
jgi:hypothetical protein